MRRRTFLAAAAGAGAVATLAGCLGDSNRELPETPSGDWRQPLYDRQNSATADVPVPPRGNPAWDDGEAHVAAPLVDGDTVFSVADEATALDARSGDERWRVDLPGRAEHSPALEGDRIFVATDERLVALDREDGDERWSTGLPRPARGPVTAVDDPPIVAVPVADTGLVVGDDDTLALHDTDGGSRERVVAAFGDRIEEPPAVADGAAFVATSDGELAAVSLAEGSVDWRVDAHVTAGTGLSVGSDAVVVSSTGLPESTSAGVAAFERTDGTVRWEHGIEGFDAYPSTAPVLAEGAVFYANNRSSGVVALGDLPPRDDD